MQEKKKEECLVKLLALVMQGGVSNPAGYRQLQLLASTHTQRLDGETCHSAGNGAVDVWLSATAFAETLVLLCWPMPYPCAIDRAAWSVRFRVPDPQPTTRDKHGLP